MISPTGTNVVGGEFLVEILTERPHLSLMSGGSISHDERVILEMTPAAICILSHTIDGQVSIAACNERYELIFSGAEVPKALISQTRLSVQLDTEVVFDAPCDTPAAIRHVRFRLQPRGDHRVICVVEDITVANEAAQEVARQREALRKATPIDPLTGAMGRRQFMDDARLELKRAARHKIPLALVMVDIDRFQDLNDAQGCEVGDDALRAVAEVLRSGLRDTDLIARVGGDEFALLLLHTDGHYGCIVTDRLRETVTIRSSMFDGAEVPVTISCGVAEYRAQEGLESLVSRAENALYTAKASGRDRVLLSD